MLEIKDFYGKVLKTVDAADLRGADLSGANLSGADLRVADLRVADLRGAALRNADLRVANLRGADLRGAGLWSADLRNADLRGANLSGADLRVADLRGADLRGAALRNADLRVANLIGALLPHFQICPEVGPFLAWKVVRLSDGRKHVIQIMVPDDAQRTSSLVGRKCRASHVVVGITEPCTSPTASNPLEYKQGETVHADKFDPDIRVECTHGIHFFMTKAEAEAYD